MESFPYSPEILIVVKRVAAWETIIWNKIGSNINRYYIKRATKEFGITTHPSGTLV